MPAPRRASSRTRCAIVSVGPIAASREGSGRLDLPMPRVYARCCGWCRSTHPRPGTRRPAHGARIMSVRTNRSIARGDRVPGNTDAIWLRALLRVALTRTPAPLPTGGRSCIRAGRGFRGSNPGCAACAFRFKLAHANLIIRRPGFPGILCHSSGGPGSWGRCRPPPCCRSY